MQFVKIIQPLGTTLWIQVENILPRIYILKLISKTQCSLARDSSKTNYYMYAYTLTQCSISFPPPPFVMFHKQVSVFFMVAEYKDGEVGGMWNTEWLWGSDRDGTGHGERTNLLYAALLDIKVPSNTQLQINTVWSQQTGDLSTVVNWAIVTYKQLHGSSWWARSLFYNCCYEELVVQQH